MARRHPVIETNPAEDSVSVLIPSNSQSQATIKTFYAERHDAEEYPFDSKESQDDEFKSQVKEIAEGDVQLYPSDRKNGFWCSPPCLGKGKTTGNQLIESRKRKNVWDQDIKKAAGGTNAGKTCDTGCAKKCAVSSPTNVGSANVSSNHLGGGGGGNGGDENEHPTNPDGDPDSDPDSGSDDTKKAEVSMAEVKNKKSMTQQERNIEEHLRINRYNTCKNKSCESCVEVARKIKDFFDNRNLNWLAVVEYHKKVCIFKQRCEVCCRLKEPELKLKSNQPLKKDSEENLIIWQLTEDHEAFPELQYFVESDHFHFCNDTYFKKGGFGEVYHIELPLSLKEKYFNGSTWPKLVLKKAVVKEDEIYVLKNTSSHPNFVKSLLLVRKDDGTFTHRIVMVKCEKSIKEYVRQVMREKKQLDISEAVFYWHQVVVAVQYLHYSLGVIHKDIKAANCLMTIENNMIRVKLADFGMVIRLWDEYTPRGLGAAGTRGFMAPEVEQRLPHGRPADIYSLAVLLLEMLFDHWRNKKKAVERLKSLDQDLGELIERCLSEDMMKRPGANEILQSPAVMKHLTDPAIDMNDVKNRLQSEG